MKKIIYLSLLAVLIAACGSHENKVTEIPIEIPAALTNNKDAETLIKEMTDAVNTCQNNMAIGAQFAIEQEKSGSDSLTVKQGFKAAKFAAKMMFAAKKIEKIRAKALELKPELSETEWTALEAKLDALETNVGDLNPEDLGLSEEEIANFKAEGELHIGEDENVVEEEIVANQQDSESGMALRQMEAEIMQEAQANNNSQNSNNESSGTSAILFTILVIVLVIIGVVLTIRKYLRKIRNARDTFGQIRNVANK